MRRIALLLATTAAALAAPTSRAAAAEAPAVPALGARVTGCETGLSPGPRAATFRGTMPSIVGASVLEMRFVLEQRSGDGWKAMSPPGFTRWEHSTPGAAGLVYEKRVERLAAGSAYRVRVRFRWSAPDGTVLRRATRVSGACRLADERRDVSVDGLTAAPLPNGRVRYVVTVRNGAAAAAAGRLRVVLAVDGVVQDAQTLSGLPADAIGVVSFDGPPCRPGGSVLARIDAPSGGDEVADADDTLKLDCPSA